MNDKTRIETITASVQTVTTSAGRTYCTGEINVNGEELASGTAPSWHGVIDMLNEALHDAVWGDDSGNEGWLK